MTGLFAAIDTRNRSTVEAALAPDVRLQVPSLGLSCAGRTEVLDALGAVLIAFPDFRYQVRSRYVAPGHVIDEAVLEGTPSGPLPGGPDGDRSASASVPARVMVAHDGRTVTAVTVWADGGALRDLVGVPGGAAGVSSPLVTALRATVPASHGRVILARDREPAVLPPDPPPSPAPPTPVVTAVRSKGLKVPVPRRVRRLQAATLGLVMLAASAALVSWVVRGTVSTSVQGAVAPANSWPPITSAIRPTEVRNEASVPIHFDRSRNEYEFSSDLLFDTNSFRLTPQARRALDEVITRIRTDHRWGRITVTGYTDLRGTAAYNVRLSQNRADAVAAALREGLSGASSRVTVVAIGRGEADPVAAGRSPEALRANRRVTVRVPKPAG